MIANSRKCIRLLKNSSSMDLFALIILTLFNLPKKKQLSEISLKDNL